MKNFLRILPFLLCSLLMAAHLFRANLLILMIISLLIPFVLIIKSKISLRIVQITLVIYSLEWIRTMISYVAERMENGDNWLRLAIILSVVALANLLSILPLKKRA